MSQIDIPAPPTLTGTDKTKIDVLRDYLFQMSRTLNEGLSTLDVDNFNPRSVIVQSVEQSKEQSVALQQRAAALKTLIISTATEITKVEDILRAEMSSTYAAKSQFGTYINEQTQKFEITAQGISGALSQSDIVSTLDTRASTLEEETTKAKEKQKSFETYISKQEGYYKLGWIEWTPGDFTSHVVGLAVGDSFTFSAESEDEETIDDVTYQKIEVSGAYGALYTSHGIRFYVNGQLAATFSYNDTEGRYSLITPFLDAGTVSVQGGLSMGKWRISQDDNGFSITYAG